MGGRYCCRRHRRRCRRRWGTCPPQRGGVGGTCRIPEGRARPPGGWSPRPSVVGSGEHPPGGPPLRPTTTRRCCTARWRGEMGGRRLPAETAGGREAVRAPPPPGTRHRARRFLLWPWHFFCSPGRRSCQSRTTCRRRPSPPVLYVRDRAQRGDRRWWSPWSIVLFLQRCVTAARGDRASPEPAADVSAACPQHPSLEAVAAATVAVVTAAGGASARAEEGRPGEELLRPTRWQCPLRPSTLPPTLPYDQTGWAVGVSSQRAIVPP